MKTWLAAVLAALIVGLASAPASAIPAVIICDPTGTFCQPLPTITQQSGLVGTVTNIKTTPGMLYSAYCINNSTTTGYAFQVFNATAANVTLGTTVPAFQAWIPASSATGSGVGVVYVGPTIGAYMNVAISVAATTAISGGSGAAASTIYCYETYQ